MKFRQQISFVMNFDKLLGLFSLISIGCGIGIIVSWVRIIFFKKYTKTKAVFYIFKVNLNNGCPEFQYSHYKFNYHERWKLVNFRAIFGATLIIEGVVGLLFSTDLIKWRTIKIVLYGVLKSITLIMNCVYLGITFSKTDKSGYNYINYPFNYDSCTCREPDLSFHCLYDHSRCCDYQFYIEHKSERMSDSEIVRNGKILQMFGIISMLGIMFVIYWIGMNWCCKKSKHYSSGQSNYTYRRRPPVYQPQRPIFTTNLQPPDSAFGMDYGSSGIDSGASGMDSNF